LPDCTPPPPFDAPGVFETCRVQGGKILHLKEHLLRLAASLKTLRLDPLDLKELQGLQASAREVRDGFVRIAVSSSKTPRVLIHRHPGLPYPKALYRRGISIHTAATREPHPEAAPSGAKCSERLSSVLARWEWAGDREVLRLGASGFLTEGTSSNLFMVKQRTLYTPPAWLGVLEGVTRALVLKAALRLGLAALEVPITRHELFNAEEAFLTNVLMGILPLRSVDGRRIGTRTPGPVTRQLARALS
jgi:branched-chain amino acid aminotransferase